MEILLTAGGKFCLPDAGKTDYRALGKLLTVELKKSLPHCGKNTLPSTAQPVEDVALPPGDLARTGAVAFPRVVLGHPSVAEAEDSETRQLKGAFGGHVAKGATIARDRKQRLQRPGEGCRSRLRAP